MTTFSTSLTALLLQSHDCSYYLTGRVLALLPLGLQKDTYLRA
jgi:hypothetical protein